MIPYPLSLVGTSYRWLRQSVPGTKLAGRCMLSLPHSGAVHPSLGVRDHLFRTALLGEGSQEGRLVLRGKGDQGEAEDLL